MASPSFDDIPDSLLTDILSRASGISQQQEQQQEHQAQRNQEQALALNTSHQQRHLCGIFTRVNHKWRVAALSICRGLDVSLIDLSAVKQLSSWLLCNGNQLQHLSVRFSTLNFPASFLSNIPISTPQLQSLKLRGLACLTGDISADDAAAWGRLTSLTSLDVDCLQAFDGPMQYLQYVEELSVSEIGVYDLNENVCAALQAKLPRLRVLRMQPLMGGVYCSLNRQALDILSKKPQLQQVEGAYVYAQDLHHPAVGLVHPSMRISLRRENCRIEQVEGWGEQGGGKQLTKLVLTCRQHPCSIVLAKLQGLPMLRSLELSGASLEAAQHQLQQLTQLTELVLEGCSPPLSLAELPQQLVKLSIDKITEQAQQPGQHRSSSTLPHLTSLTLSHLSITDATMREVSSLPQLQDLTLVQTDRVTPSGGLACLQQLDSLTSLRLSRFMPESGLGSDGCSVLSDLSSLRYFAITNPETAGTGLGLAEALAHVPSIQLLVGDWNHHEKVAGGSAEVRHGT